MQTAQTVFFLLSIPNISGQNKPLIPLLFCALRHLMSSAPLSYKARRRKDRPYALRPFPPAIPVQGTFFAASFCPITPQDSPQEEQAVCSPTFSFPRPFRCKEHFLPPLFVLSLHKIRRKKNRQYASRCFHPAIPVQGTFFTAFFCPITPQDSPQEGQTVCSPTFSFPRPFRCRKDVRRKSSVSQKLEALFSNSFCPSFLLFQRSQSPHNT